MLDKHKNLVSNVLSSASNSIFRDHLMSPSLSLAPPKDSVYLLIASRKPISKIIYIPYNPILNEFLSHTVMV